MTWPPLDEVRPGRGERARRHETSLPGVFAAGDVRHGSIKRLSSAVGEGATAVQVIHEYLASHPVVEDRPPRPRPPPPEVIASPP